MRAVYLKELRQYFTGSTSYACFALIFLISAVYTWAINITGQTGSFEITIANMSFWITLLPVPLLTMRIFSEERKQKTLELLYSLPIKATGMVLGKYFAALTTLLVPTAVLAVYPLALSFFGNVNFLTSYSALIALFLLNAAFIAIGEFISSLTENQIISAIGVLVIIFFNYFLPSIASYASQSAVSSIIFLVILGVAVGAIVYLMTKNIIAGVFSAVVINFGLILLYVLKPDVLEGFIPSLMNAISLFAALEEFSAGTFDLTGVVFFLSVAAVFLFLTVQSVEKRRWAS